MVTKLCEITEFIIDTKHNTPKYSEDGYPCIRTPNIGRGNFILENVRYVDETTYIKWTERAVPRTSDLILAREAPVGNVAWIPPNLKPCIGQRTVLIRPKTDYVNSRYLTYLLLGDECQNRMQSMSGGATVAHLNMSDIRSLELPELPSLSAQKKIAAILSAYDDLIENNLRRIKILEEMAQMIYREWFVNFRFPGHEKVEMVDSPSGKIPEEWDIDKLGSFVSVDKGVSYKGSGLTPEGNPMVNLKNILPNGGFRRDATKPYSGDYKVRHVVYPGDIVLANTDLTQAGNVVGSPAIIPDINYGRDILISHHIYAVRIKDKIITPPHFIYHLLLSPEFKGFAKGYAIGTTVLGLAKEGILEFTFAKPPSEIAQGFDDYINPIYAVIENYHKRNDILRRTCDLLLPKLISGELDVSELDIAIPEGV